MTELSNLLLEWYSLHGRDLPWRHKGGAHPDPYAVIVSEFMLQQTTVKTVLSYFTKFMQRFPSIQSLAAASLDEVYQLWQGLGYYTRARSLHQTAQIIIQDYNGIIPSNKENILKLKGIGPYTVASILALGFNQPETVIDGNVMRIIARLYHLTAPLQSIQDIIKHKAQELTPPNHAADYASAIMDLGATICTPKNPQCLLCPWQHHCLSATEADIEKIPQRLKNTKKEKHGCVYIINNSRGELFIRKRIEKGLLSGLYEFPWNEGTPKYSSAKNTTQTISHIFTHFKLTLHIYQLQTDTPQSDGLFISPKDLSNYAISTLMKKVFTQYTKHIQQL